MGQARRSCRAAQFHRGEEENRRKKDSAMNFRGQFLGRLPDAE